MKKSLSFALIMLVSFIALAVFVQNGIAADSILDTTIKSVTVSNDKNGNEYVRFIIVEDKELHGIEYKADVVTMAFGSAVEKAKTYSDGDQLKAIISQNEYRGRTSYNIIAFVE